MRQFHVRHFFETPRPSWKCEYNERFMLEFDDGTKEVVTTARMEVSKMLWLPHEQYSRLPLLSRHVIPKGPLPNKKIQGLLSAVARDMQDIYGTGNYNREELWYWIYKAEERLFNTAIVDYSEYVRSVNSFHYLQLYNHPPIKEARENIKPNDLSIAKGQRILEDILLHDIAISRNPVVSDLRCGIMKMEQLLQIIGVRGANTDIDDFIYKTPIMGNYFAGIHDPAEAMMESTLAGKSIIFTGAPLEQTEYANRKLQFTSQRVDLLVMGDCGADYLSAIEITDDRFKSMLGLYFRDQITGRLRALEQTDKKLIGQTLEFRLAFNCRHRHMNCVCAVCYGDLAYNVPYGANIGHIASTKTQSEVSQRVLKVKHSESSTVSEAIKINSDEREYILPGKELNQIVLNPRLREKGVKMLLRSTPKARAACASKLPILKKSDVQEGMSAAKHSQFRDVSFEIPSNTKRPVRYHVSVSRGARMSYLTNDFLRWFLSKGFSIQDDAMYHIDLNDWDFSKPVFELPNKHVSMKDFAAEVEVFIRSTHDDSSRHLGQLRQLRQYTDPVEALLDLHGLIQPKVHVHFTHLAVVMLALMVPAVGTGSYKIPEVGQPIRFAKYDEVINGGSLGALFAYQGGSEQLTKVGQYLNTDRPSHLLDPLLLPL